MSRIEVEREQLERWRHASTNAECLAMEDEIDALLTPSPKRDEWDELVATVWGLEDWGDDEREALAKTCRALHAKLVAKVEEERDLAKHVSRANADEVLRLKSLPLVPRPDARRLAEVALNSAFGPEGLRPTPRSVESATAAIETELNKAGERGTSSETAANPAGNTEAGTPPSPALSGAEIVEAWQNTYYAVNHDEAEFDLAVRIDEAISDRDRDWRKQLMARLLDKDTRIADLEVGIQRLKGGYTTTLPHDGYGPQEGVPETPTDAMVKAHRKRMALLMHVEDPEPGALYAKVSAECEALRVTIADLERERDLAEAKAQAQHDAYESERVDLRAAVEADRRVVEAVFVCMEDGHLPEGKRVANWARVQDAVRAHPEYFAKRGSDAD